MDERAGHGDQTPPAGTVAVSHLGILVVYHLKDDDDLPLLELHLDRIARHTLVPYTLFAVVNRVTDRARALVRAAPRVVICEVPPTDRRASREHAYYLDAMVPRALAAGCSHLCTLDVDSFPIDDRWLEVLVAAMPPEAGLAGILRTENSDVALAHPSCVLATREFFERFAPSFSPDPIDSVEYRAFVRETGQLADTGIRLTAALWSAGLPWGRITRTNAVDPHYLIAGIYGDVVFHLGGIARGKVFRTDLVRSRVHRWSRPLEHLPAPGAALGAAKRRVIRAVRGPAERRMAEHNRVAYSSLREQLFSDPDRLFATLRGRPLPADVPVPGDVPVPADESASSDASSRRSA